MRRLIPRLIDPGSQRGHIVVHQLSGFRLLRVRYEHRDCGIDCGDDVAVEYRGGGGIHLGGRREILLSIQGFGADVSWARAGSVRQRRSNFTQITSKQPAKRLLIRRSSMVTTSFRISPRAGRFRRSRIRMTRKPGQKWRGTTSTVTTGAITRRNCSGCKTCENPASRLGRGVIPCRIPKGRSASPFSIRRFGCPLSAAFFT